MPCVRFNAEKKAVEILERENGGNKFTGAPIYMIQCQCGYPLKVMFDRPRPRFTDTADFRDCTGDEQIEIVEVKNHGWGATLTKENCPKCGAAISIGPSLLHAAADFIQTHVISRGHHRTRDGRLIITDKVKATLEKIVRFKGVRVIRESIAGRHDYAIVWHTGNEKHEWGEQTFDEWWDTREKELNAMKKFLKLKEDDSEPEESDDPYDFSDEVMNVHGEECTCSLCLK